MLYDTGAAWAAAPARRIMLFGMSGLGKTRLASLLRARGGWFHYSVDYRIGTRYMGEHIADNFKREAMRVPLLRELLLNDGIYVASNITFDNLTPLSTYLGKPGDPARGGLPIADYRVRQAQHRTAEVAALLDTVHFIDRARDLYGYDHFVCDSGGSICEVVDPADPDDPVMTALSRSLLPVWIEGTDAHTRTLIDRFDRAPKPMCYEAGFLDDCWAAYLRETGQSETDVDPDAFIRWTYARAMAHRQPRYADMARRWGVTVTAAEAAGVADADDLVALVATAIDRRGSPG